MINADMQEYSYYLYAEDNGYGQPALTDEAQGTIKIAVYTTAQGIQDNIQYKGATYLGLTNDTKINDKYVIGYGSAKLKVLYVNAQGRYKQVFMGDM
jgi:hypothetical protein